ncbi:PDDEXK nuclease domain-containing protein [Leifsonia xyli]|uniref:PDDEXK nuclease domain-containing protein n=1 Tax=Leifsonia xyli TaxID=1575 RepID=UPI001CB81CF9|nr:PDDEXK nuclease domain-containing protein [Leifsonia xyli]
MNQLRSRLGAAPANFQAQLESADAAQAQSLAKDPFVFDFLGLKPWVAERDLEQALLDRIVETLRELGPGFTFAVRQMRFDVGGDEYILDLLFFHTIQLRYVVVELKIGRFEPEYAGKLGFYVELVDERLRQPSHAPTVGILLCNGKNEVSSATPYAARLSQWRSPLTPTSRCLPTSGRLYPMPTSSPTPLARSTLPATGLGVVLDVRVRSSHRTWSVGTNQQPVPAIASWRVHTRTVDPHQKPPRPTQFQLCETGRVRSSGYLRGPLARSVTPGSQTCRDVRCWRSCRGHRRRSHRAW